MNGKPRNSVLTPPRPDVLVDDGGGRNSSVYRRQPGTAGRPLEERDPRVQHAEHAALLRDASEINDGSRGRRAARVASPEQATAASAPGCRSRSRTRGRPYVRTAGCSCSTSPPYAGEVCLSAPRGGRGVGFRLRDTRSCTQFRVDGHHSRDTRDEDREHLGVSLRLDFALECDAAVDDGDADASGLDPEGPAQDVVRISPASSLSPRVKARTMSARVRIPTSFPSSTTGRRFTPSETIFARGFVHRSRRPDRPRRRRHGLSHELRGDLVLLDLRSKSQDSGPAWPVPPLALATMSASERTPHDLARAGDHGKSETRCWVRSDAASRTTPPDGRKRRPRS